MWGAFLAIAVVSGIVAAYGTTLGLLAVVGAAAGTGALIAATRWGFRTLLLVVMAAAVLTVPMNGVRLGALAVSDYLLLLAALLLALSRLSAPRSSYLPSFQPFLLPAGMIILGGLIGTFFSRNAPMSIVELAKFSVSTVGLFILVAVWAPDGRQLRILAWSFTIGGAVSVLAEIFFIQESHDRSVGFSIHPNHLAMASLLASGISLGLALTSRRTPRRLAVALCVVHVGGIVTSGSRAALGGAVAFFIIYLFVTRQWRVVRWATVGAACCAGLLAAGVIRVPESNALARILGNDPTSVESDEARASLRSETLERIDAHPLTGDGFAGATLGHSLYLQLWASAGLLGLAGFFTLVLVVVRMMVSRPRPDPLVMAMLASYSGYLVAAYASNVYWDRYVWLHLALAVGLFVAGREADHEGGALIIPPAATTVRRARLHAASPLGAFRATQ